MVSISQLSSALSAPPFMDLPLVLIDRFIRFARHLKPEISLSMQDPIAPPKYLPPHVAQFLSKALELSAAIISTLWSTLRFDVWDLVSAQLCLSERSLFDEHGSRTIAKHHKLAYYMFYPPHTKCPRCGSTLTSISRVQATECT
ncbi:hypothetical protein F5890DRAFT_704373 [Lentinula detonsa]|uniref:Uncharacterized protein n=1 Tax=Lentinula detonsa TaxID=2804962 RepID=A0AA38UYQ9_9AGAR|nr:hypothetical protein F5890DRAFT_704373 [Lentinula detonsa]